MGSIPITRSIFILAHKNSVNQWFCVWELINLTTKTYNISIVVHGSQIRDELVPLAYFYRSSGPQRLGDLDARPEDPKTALEQAWREA